MNLSLARAKNRWLRVRMKGRDISPVARRNLEALDSLRPWDSARSHSFVVLDMETTGLDSRRDRVVSLGAFRVVEGRVRLGEIFSELVNPGRDIPVESIKVHAIVPDMIHQARPAWEVFDDFMEFAGNDILVAHYAPFDLHFLNKVMRERYGFSLQNLILDTVEICRATMLVPDPHGVYQDFKRCSLDALAKRFNLEVPERHTALGDALATAMVLQRMFLLLEERDEGTLGHMIKAGALAL